jgi:hypothetical protein
MLVGTSRKTYTGIRIAKKPYHSAATSAYCAGVKRRNAATSVR